MGSGCSVNGECNGEVAKQLLREVGKAIGILQMSEVTVVTQEEAVDGMPLSVILIEFEGYQKALGMLEGIYSFVIKGCHA